MDVAAEEMGHVEMIATIVARLLEGAPAAPVPHWGWGLAAPYQP
jgi:Mn-containing catalase